MENINRQVAMRCPVCASKDFKYDADDPNSLVECNNCKAVFTRDEIMQANDAAIQSAIEDAKKDAFNMVKDEMKKIFKNLGH